MAVRRSIWLPLRKTNRSKTLFHRVLGRPHNRPGVEKTLSYEQVLMGV